MAFAILVDAGFLMASAAHRVGTNKAREGIRCQYPELVSGLISLIDAHSDDSFLRMYWYDASMNGIPDMLQQAISELPGVKLRLGRLVHGLQKGVDSRIIVDMLTLAERRAVSEFYLISGDGDLVEGVEEAQQHGSRVVVVGVPGVIQSRVLKAAADELLTIPSELISSTVSITEATGVTPREAGAAFAGIFCAEYDPACITELKRQTSPVIPKGIDAELMRYADPVLGGILRDNPDLREDVRAGFWTQLKAS